MKQKTWKLIRDIVIAILTAIITALSAVSCLAYSNPQKFANTKIYSSLNSISYGIFLR